MTRQSTAKKTVSVFTVPNIRRFIAFRVFFNSRFYYPVFTILFLDFGLTVAQFSILNAVWAASIVLAEVPLGALADIIGRKRLLVGAAVIMIIEIGMICIVPENRPTLVFIVFLVNRILSGVAEAAASGADEAIAYDALAAEGLKDQWGRVLELLMRFQSIGFMLSMSIGAAVYDPGLMTAICQKLGLTLSLSQETTMRFPLYLTLILSLGALTATLRMTDTMAPSGSSTPGQIRQAVALTLKAGLWIMKTPFALCVILFGMVFDGIIRMVITLSSQYYRIIELPESIFGLIGSLVATLGIIVPKAARKLAEHAPLTAPLWITAALTLTGLSTMNRFWPYAGMVPALITFSAMYFNGFFVSYHLNRTASSEQRATVLSFKGLAYNISYGVLGTFYALILKTGKQGLEMTGNLEDLVFTRTFFWFPLSFVVLFFLVLIAARLFFKPSLPKP